jgi:hypothetical protein
MKLLEYNRIILCLTLLAVASCKKTYYAPHETTANLDAEVLDVKVDVIPIECFGAMGLVALDSQIVVFTNDKESMIKVYDYDGQNIAKLSPSGRAGNEFLDVQYAWRNKTINGDRFLYLLDPSDGTYYQYNLSESIRRMANVRPIKLQTRTRFVNDVLFRDDGAYFQYQGVSYDDPRDMIFFPPEFKLIDSNGKEKEYLIYPNLVDFKENKAFSTIFYQHTVRMSLDCKKVVIVSHYEDRITFIDLDTDSIFGLRCKDFVDIQQYADASIETIAKKCIMGVRQVCVVENGILLLYDKRSVYDAEVLEKPLDTTIRVYSWEGLYLAEINPSVILSDFSIDVENGYLIGLDEDEHFYIANIANILNSLFHGKER